MDYINLGVLVNNAMGLDVGNRFGKTFIADFFIQKRSTGMKEMTRWCRQGNFHSGDGEDVPFKQFTMTTSRHTILSSILDIMLLMEKENEDE